MQMYYEEHGEGEPLVLLHWYGASGEHSWSQFVPQLKTKFRLIVPDLRGHGRSTNPRDEFTHLQSALDVFALLDHLGIDTFRAMGTSTGGMTLIHMATQQPDRVKAMVLVGATHYFPNQARVIMRKETVESFANDEMYWKENRKIHHHGDAQIRKIQQLFHKFKDSYDDMNFTVPFLGTIRARTLIVHGDRDEFFPVEIPVEMYTSIPNASLWIVPNGGHLPLLDDKLPFIDTVLEFFAESFGNNP
ncbi:alpha/beta fold hydrolase [Planctomycetaceae bacterium SH139]